MKIKASDFPAHAVFWDYEGIPISEDAGTPGMLCAAWDTTPPRNFDPASARRNGNPIDVHEFVSLVNAQAES